MSIGFLTFHWTDILDIVLVAFLLYQAYSIVRGSIASRVFLGFILLYFFYLVIKSLRLELMTTILQYFMGVGAVALIVIFQQEIRRFLLILGKSTIFTNNNFLRNLFGNTIKAEQGTTIKTIVEASKTIASEFSGALIVIKKNDELDKFIDTGEILDSRISKPLLVSIFNQYSNLRDGAVIIANDRIASARSVLPVAEGSELSAEIGFRHRAALVMSELTDAAVIVISEQTGKISLAIGSKLSANVTASQLERHLTNYLNSNTQRLVETEASV